mmetsp:Transcript_30086/g.47424  ORF Transcript_30086/g.47424 Transcript_30086/m.47424 type:complete len:441 (-) Transcript_30086:216-1538(-)
MYHYLAAFQGNLRSRSQEGKKGINPFLNFDSSSFSTQAKNSFNSVAAQAFAMLPGPTVACCEEPKKMKKDLTKKWYYYSGPPADARTLKRVKLFSGSMGTEMGADVAELLGIGLARANLGQYVDGEISLQLAENVRGKDVFLIAPTTTNDGWMELFLLTACCARASAKQVTAVIPFFGYSRLDQRVAREPIAASDMARALEEMGVDRVVSVDMHTQQLAGFFRCKIPADNVEPWGVAAGYFAEQLAAGHEGRAVGVTVVAAHENHMKRAKTLQGLLARRLAEHYPQWGQSGDGGPVVSVAAVSKMRTREDHSRGVHRQLIGEAKGEICIIVDDLCDTGTTLVEAAQLLKEEGAVAVWGFSTHGRFSGDGARRVSQCQALDYLVCTDTIPFQRFLGEDVLNSGKIRQLSIAPLIAEIIHRIHDKKDCDDILFPSSKKKAIK